ncbi:MAG: hypothetical protein V1859_11305 [archaeon]
MDKIYIDIKYSMKEHVSCGVTTDELKELANSKVIASVQKEIEFTLSKKEEKGRGFTTALGVLNSAFDKELRQAIKDTLSDIKKCGIEVKHVIHAGIGGSELGATALYNACGNKKIKYYPITSLNTDYINSIMKSINPKKTILIQVSRSGTTKETLTSYSVVKNYLEKKLGEAHFKHCVSILGTDKDDIAKKQAAHTKVKIIGSMSGRFTGLHAANLFTMAILGVDIEEFHAGAREMLEKCAETTAIKENQALHTAALKYHMNKHKGKLVFMTNAFTPYLVKYGDWLDQLTEESLGHNENITHCTKTTELSNKLHSDFQNWLGGANIFYHQFIFQLKPRSRTIKNPLVERETLGDIELAAYLGTVKSLAMHNRPSFTTFMTSVNEYTLGQLFMRDMLSTIYLCELYGLGTEPGISGKGYFNQPGVQAYKKIMGELLKDKALMKKELGF